MKKILWVIGALLLFSWPLIDRFMLSHIPPVDFPYFNVQGKIEGKWLQKVMNGSPKPVDWLLFTDESDIRAVTNGQTGPLINDPVMAGAMRRSIITQLERRSTHKNLFPWIIVSADGSEFRLYLPEIQPFRTSDTRVFTFKYNRRLIFPRYKIVFWEDVDPEILHIITDK